MILTGSLCVKHATGQWCEATIVDTRANTSDISIHHEGYNKEHDEWIACDSDRLQLSQEVLNSLRRTHSEEKKVSLERKQLQREEAAAERARLRLHSEEKGQKYTSLGLGP